MYLINRTEQVHSLIIIAGLSFYSFGWPPLSHRHCDGYLVRQPLQFPSGYAFAWCKCKGLIEDNEEDVQ